MWWSFKCNIDFSLTNTTVFVLGDVLVILDLRPDDSLFEAGAAREVQCKQWTPTVFASSSYSWFHVIFLDGFIFKLMGHLNITATYLHAFIVGDIFPCRLSTEFRNYERNLLWNPQTWWRFILNHWMRINQFLKEFCTHRLNIHSLSLDLNIKT